MPKIVVGGGFLKCSHGGLTKLSKGNSKLTIGGAAAVTSGMETGYSFLPTTAPPTPDQPAPCTQMTSTTPPAPSPCSATSPATGGISSKITVGGAGVLLDTATGPAVNPADPSAKWTISDAGETKMNEG